MTLYQLRKNQGICTRCGENPSESGKTQCADCKQDRNERVKVLREARMAEGLCRCGNNIQGDTKYCEDCLGRQRDRNSEVRRLVLEVYGKKCACCGESEEAFLGIDHVNNDGSKHRKQINCTKGGTPFYQWLKKNNFPDGFQTLCMNCNFAKQKLGVCPHQTRGGK